MFKDNKSMQSFYSLSEQKKLQVVNARMQEEFLALFGSQTSNRLSDNDIQRIAEAVCDEQERRAAHPLRVTKEDIRRYIK